MDCPICDTPLRADRVTRGCPSCRTEAKDILIEALNQLKALYLKAESMNKAILRQQAKLDYFKALDEAQDLAWYQSHES